MTHFPRSWAKAIERRRRKTPHGAQKTDLPLAVKDKTTEMLCSEARSTSYRRVVPRPKLWLGLDYLIGKWVVRCFSGLRLPFLFCLGFSPLRLLAVLFCRFHPSTPKNTGSPVRAPALEKERQRPLLSTTEVGPDHETAVVGISSSFPSFPSFPSFSFFAGFLLFMHAPPAPV